jgi:trk system potassium uptake protein TrkA
LKVVIVGAGEVGFHIARRLATENKDVVVVDIDREALRRVSDHIDVKTVLGSGSSPVTLKKTDLKNVEIIIREKRVMIPSGRSVIDPGDRIIIFAKKQAIPKLEKILTVKPDYY